MALAHLEVVIVVDENGNYAVGADCYSAAERYRDEVGEPDGALCLRTIVIDVNVPIPAPISAIVNVPEIDETALVTVK